MPLKIAIGASLPKIRIRLLLKPGVPVDLSTATSAAVQFRKKGSATPTASLDASIVSPATDGWIEIDNPGSVLEEAGAWVAVSSVEFPGGPMVVPADPDDGLELQVASALEVFSTIESFRDPLRILLGDLEPDARMYSDRSLDEGVRTTLAMGLAPGYALTPTRNSVSPAVVTPAAFALITLETARMFVSGRPDRQSVRTRVASESVGSYAQLLRTIETRLSELKGGGAPVSSWQNLYSFMVGTQGLPDIAMFSTVKVEQSLKEFSIYARSSAL